VQANPDPKEATMHTTVTRPADPARHPYVGSAGTCTECGLHLNSPQHSVLPDGTYAAMVVIGGREYPLLPAEDRGMLAEGTVLPDRSVVVCTTLTGYKVDEPTPGAHGALHWSPSFRTFDQVHGRPAPATPLVVFG
jgi:hypothetical protein